MAQTSATGFRFRKSMHGSDVPVRMVFRAGNSATLRVGDAVSLNTSGLVVNAGAARNVLGICGGLVDEVDLNPFSLGYINNTGATLTPDDQVTTASNNSTKTHYIKVEVIIDTGGDALFYNQANTTAALTQAMVGQCFNCDSTGQQIDTNTNSETSGQFQLLVLDPDNDASTAKGLFRIVLNQLLGGFANATAIRTA